MRKILMGVVLAAGVWAQKPADDLCTLPPSSRPPLLPARLLDGQGRSHLPITTKAEEAQRFFDQGLAQMHNFSSYEAERSFLQAARPGPGISPCRAASSPASISRWNI